MPLRQIKHFNLRHIICGTWCSGTAYVSRVLTAAGYPCTHERFFFNREAKVWETFDNDPSAESALADSSFTWMDYGEYAPASELPIVLLLRNPVDIINSVVAFELRSGRTVDIEKRIEWMVNLYSKIKKTGRVKYVARVEHDMPVLCNYFGVKFPVKEAIDRNKHNHGRINMHATDLDGFPSFQKLRSMSEPFYAL